MARLLERLDHVEDPMSEGEEMEEERGKQQQVMVVLNTDDPRVEDDEVEVENHQDVD